MVTKTKTNHEQDIITDAVETICELARKNGTQINDTVAIEAEKIIRAKWWGDRPYICVKADTEKRNAQIRADYQRGERVAFLVRKYKISKARIYDVLKMT